MKILKLLSFSFFTILLFTSFKFTDGWAKAYSKEGLVIYTRTTAGGLKEFKAVSTLDATVGEVTAVFKDWKTHPNWMRTMVKSELVEQTNVATRYLYYVIDFPWPLWDRDLITKSTFSKGKDGSMTMTVGCEPTKKPKDKTKVRIEVASGFWKLMPLENGKSQATYQYKADPVGIPTGIVNMFLLEGPKESFEGLRKHIQLKQYKGATLDWIK
jgi:hypothetical protein